MVGFQVGGLQVGKLFLARLVLVEFAALFSIVLVAALL